MVLTVLLSAFGTSASAEEVTSETAESVSIEEISTLFSDNSTAVDIGRALAADAPGNGSGKQAQAANDYVWVCGTYLTRTQKSLSIGGGRVTLDMNTSPAKLTFENVSLTATSFITGNQTKSACLVYTIPLEICLVGSNKMVYNGNNYSTLILGGASTVISGTGSLDMDYSCGYTGSVGAVGMLGDTVIKDSAKIAVDANGLSSATAVVAWRSLGSVELRDEATLNLSADYYIFSVGLLCESLTVKDKSTLLVIGTGGQSFGVFLKSDSGRANFIDVQSSNGVIIGADTGAVCCESSFSLKCGDTIGTANGTEHRSSVIYIPYGYYQGYWVGTGSTPDKILAILPKKIYIDLYMNDGTDNFTTVYVSYGGQLGNLGTPARHGYSFLGWYTEEGKKVSSSDICKNTCYMELYAHWKYDGKTAYLNANGGSCAASSVEFLSGEKIELPTPKKSGYTFLGWFTAAEGGTQVKSGSTFTGANGVTLYAHWAVNPTADTRITVPEGKKVDYRSKVKFAVSASNLPADCSLAVYNGSVLAVKGEKGAASVEYTSEELKAETTYTVKVLDANGNVCLDSDGDPLAKEITVKVNRSFIKKIVAFFKNLFGTLPTINL